MPSLAITDLHLEDLENIKSVQITKLKRIGIESVLELATSIPQELADEASDTVKNMSCTMFVRAATSTYIQSKNSPCLLST